jgi:glycosyltransferase involved in cell wall biosynthesis
MSEVSIIIPMYNAEQYISETLDSCLAQNDGLVREILVVDDHSTDNGRSLVESYAKRNSQIRLLINPKKGANAARNYGLTQAGGGFIQFLDADDLLSKNKISLQVQRLKKASQKAIANCPWAHFDNNPDEASFSSNILWKDYTTPIQWLIDAWTNGQMMASSSWLCPKKLLLEAGPWDESLIKNQDGEYFTRVILKAEEIIFVEAARIYYRKPGPQNLSKQSGYRHQLSLLQSYISYEEKIRSVIDSIEIRTACAQNYVNFIYQTFSQHPQLADMAEERLLNLDISNRPLAGGKVFQIFSQIIGFKKTLALKKWLGNNINSRAAS